MKFSKKKPLSFLMAVMVFLNCLSFSAFADDVQSVEGNEELSVSQNVYSKPVSTFSILSDDVLITTADELISLSNTSFLNQEEAFAKTYVLQNDIDLNDATVTDKLKPIGTSSRKFTGVFDGNGYTIKNASVSAGQYTALFSYLSETGTVKNLTVENSLVSGSSDCVGTIAGYNEGTISNVTLISPTASAASSTVGGLAAYNKGLIENCTVLGGSVSGGETDETTTNTLAGLVGKNAGEIKKSSAQNTVITDNSGSKSTYTTNSGGLVGTNLTGGVIEESFADCDVNIIRWSGGFVGKMEGGSITNCYSRGSIPNENNNGGFVGYISGGEIINSYTASEITDSDTALSGAFAGRATSGSAENAFYNSDIITLSQIVNDGSLSEVSGKTTEELKGLLSTLNSQGEVWTLSDEKNGGMPYLSNVAPKDDEPASSTKEITVNFLAADYENYEFVKLVESISVTFETENGYVLDAMEAAKAQGLFSFTAVDSSYGKYITEISGKTAEGTDGWMFTINDTPSGLGASQATLEDGDSVLWYLGTSFNQYKAPSWAEVMGEGSSELGSKLNPYIISEASDLDLLREHRNAYFSLANDIDLAGISFEPIGSEEEPFNGKLKGNNNSIKNLTVIKDESSKNVGFFGVINTAVITGLNIENANIEGGSRIGILAGSSVENANGASSIASCNVSGTVKGTGQDVIKAVTIGGFIGFNDGNNTVEGGSYGSYVYSTIENCTADVSVYAQTPSEEDAGRVGGFVGFNRGIVSKSKAYGEVHGYNTTGGFVGSNFEQILDCVSYGDVYGAVSVGGFAGASTVYTTIKNSASLGDVFADSSASGMYAGGFIGAASGKTENCISIGTLSKGYSYNGGFAGHFDGSILTDIVNCFGNSIDALGSELKGIGSYIPSADPESSADKAYVAAGVSKEASIEKLYEILGISVDSPEPSDSLEKVKETLDALAVKFSSVNNTSEFLSQWQASALSAYGKKDNILNQKALSDYFVSSINSSKVTDYEKTVIALSAMGYNAKKFASNDGQTVDLVSSIANFTQSDIGINGAMYALIAYYSGHYDLSENVYWTENKLIDYILANELSSGGYAYWGDAAETDLTAMAVTALSPYCEERTDVKELIDRLINILSETQNSAGGYDTSWGTDSSDSVSQVIIALSAMGIDLSNDSRFIKNGNTLIDNLLTFKTENNEFLYATGGEESSISTEQAFLALTSYYRLKNESLDSYNVYGFGTFKSEISVNVFVYGNENEIIPSENISLGENAKASDALKEILLKNSVGYEETNGIFTTIGDEASGRFESNDSWRFAVNGVKYNKSLDDYILSDKDTLIVYYGNDNTDFAAAAATFGKTSDDISIYVSIGGNAASNASVYLDNEFAGSTDSFGKFFISKENAVSGTHALRVSLFDENGLTKVIQSSIELRIPRFETADVQNKDITVGTEDVIIDFEENVTKASFDLSNILNEGSAAVPAIYAENGGITLTVLKDTVVTGPSGWNGKVLLPFAASPQVSNADIYKGVTVGLESGSITFDRPVRVFIPDTNGKKIGFIKDDGTIKEITKVLSKDDYVTALSELSAGGVSEGKISVDGGTAIWTKHFTTFVAYTILGGGTNEKVYISVSDPKGTTYLYRTEYDFDGQTALSLLLSTGLSVTVEDGYVSSINGLSELDKGEESGWMFKVNGSFPTISASYYNLSAGDYVEWLYTTDLGADIGDDSYSGGGSSSSKAYSELYKSVDNAYLKQLILVLEDEDSTESLILSTAKEKLVNAANEIEGKSTKDKKEDFSNDILKITDLVIEKLSDVKGLKSTLKQVLSKTKEYDYKGALNTAENAVLKAGIFEVSENTISKDVLGSITDVLSFQKEIADIFSDEDIEKNIVLNISEDISGITLKSYQASAISAKGFDGVYAVFENGKIFVSAKALKAQDIYFLFEASEDGFNIGVTAENKGLEKAVYYIFSDEASGVKKMPEQEEINTKRKNGAISFAVNDTSVSKYSLYSENQNENSAYFNDLAGFEWAEPSISLLAEKGYISGREAGKYEPKSTITRAEFAAIVVRMFGDESEDSRNTVFSDVPQDKWYYKEVYTAYEKGFFSGKENNLFDPEKSITRQEAAVCAAALTKKFSLGNEDEDLNIKYSDEDVIAAWAKDDVYFVLKKGIMQGHDNKFNPDSEITRAEAAVVLEKLSSSFVKK